MSDLHPSQYERFVAEQWSHRRNAAAGPAPRLQPEALRQLYIMATGLAGETGEVMEHLKKYVRDGKLDRDALALELGDVLYYLVRIGAEFGFSLDEIQRRNVEKLMARRARD